MRCITPIDSVGDPMLVVFIDALKAAYGAATYVVWILSDNSTEERLVLAESLNASKKQYFRQICTVRTNSHCSFQTTLIRHSRLTLTDVMSTVG